VYDNGMRQICKIRSHYEQTERVCVTFMCGTLYVTSQAVWTFMCLAITADTNKWFKTRHTSHDVRASIMSYVLL
jgi:hypothetical protein